jgi:hypothetical protein
MRTAFNEAAATPSEMPSRLLTSRPPAQDDRGAMLERLSQLRAVLPVIAQELAVARREAARLRIENHKLQEEVDRTRPG